MAGTLPPPRMLWPLTAAVAMHALLLTGAGGPGAGQPDGRMAAAPAHGAAPAPHAAADAPQRAMQVRWLARPAAGIALSSPPDASSTAPAADVADAAAPRDAPVNANAPVPVDAPRPSPREDASAAPRMASLPPGEASPGAPAAEQTAGWLPREALTQAPRALRPVVIDYPEGVHPDSPVVRMKLALYIDERGHVRRTAPVGDRLEAAFELAANDAFLQARFSPGQLGPHAVRSRIVVEVIFETLPADGAESRGVRVASTH